MTLKSNSHTAHIQMEHILRKKENCKKPWTLLRNHIAYNEIGSIYLKQLHTIQNKKKSNYVNDIRCQYFHQKRYKYKIKYEKKPFKLEISVWILYIPLLKIYFLILATVNPGANDQPSCRKSPSSTPMLTSKHHLPLKGARLLGGQNV